MRFLKIPFLFIALTLVSCTPNISLTTATISASTQELLPIATLTLTPQPSAIPTETPQTNIAYTSTNSLAFKSLPSPNGNFIASAFFGASHPSGVQTIEIRDKNGKLIWHIPYQGELPTGDPQPLLTIYQWSSDSHYLYFHYVWSPDGGDRAFWWTGYDLQKFDLNTGNIQRVLPGKDFMSYAISPDGTQIAYIRRQDKPSIIYILDLSTMLEKTAYVLFPETNYCPFAEKFLKS
jgi:hypothetical protein